MKLYILKYKKYNGALLINVRQYCVKANSLDEAQEALLAYEEVKSFITNKAVTLSESYEYDLSGDTPDLLFEITVV